MDFSPRPRCVVPTPLIHLDFHIIYQNKNKQTNIIIQYLVLSIILLLCIFVNFLNENPIVENEFHISSWLLRI
jgi:hypothetical protein